MSLTGIVITALLVIAFCCLFIPPLADMAEERQKKPKPVSITQAFRDIVEESDARLERKVASIEAEVMFAELISYGVDPVVAITAEDVALPEDGPVEDVQPKPKIQPSPLRRRPDTSGLPKKPLTLVAEYGDGNKPIVQLPPPRAAHREVAIGVVPTCIHGLREFGSGRTIESGLRWSAWFCAGPRRAQCEVIWVKPEGEE